jgi:ribose 5-phosphate isomerase B
MLYLASDHAGFEMKQQLLLKLTEAQIPFTDLGPYTGDSVDYPDFAHKLAESVLVEPENRGILLCGSGNGVCITANKHQGIRAALCWTAELAHLARSHNDANVLCIPARFVSFEIASDMVEEFLATAFEGGRHQKRVEKI